jgi:hypothetical protein
MAPSAESHQRRRIRAYFTPRPKWPGRLTAVALLVIAGGVAVHRFDIALVGLALVAVALYVLIAKPGIATDAEVDRCVQQDRRRVPSRAAQRSGMDPDKFVEEPIVFAYDLGFAAGGNGFKASRRGSDRARRTTPVGATVVNMTRNQLFVYQCAIDLSTGNLINEQTKELFWRDVVSVDTATDTRTLSVTQLPLRERKLLVEDGWHIVNDVIQYDGEESVSISMTSGQAVKLAFWDGRSADKTDPADAENDRAMGRLRYVVRNMKERAHGGQG